MPGKIGGRTVAMMYKIRTKLLRKSAKFVLGRDPREIRCMEILRDLILGERVTITPTSNTVLTLTRIICKPTRWS